MPIGCVIQRVRCRGVITDIKGGQEMKIDGKVYCFFEQSGTFKNQFIKLGIPAEDYDIQNNFGETDHVIDLFNEIEKAYEGGQNLYLTILRKTILYWLSSLASTFVQQAKWRSFGHIQTIVQRV